MPQYIPMVKLTELWLGLGYTVYYWFYGLLKFDRIFWRCFDRIFGDALLRQRLNVSNWFPGHKCPMASWDRSLLQRSTSIFALLPGPAWNSR